MDRQRYSSEAKLSYFDDTPRASTIYKSETTANGAAPADERPIRLSGRRAAPPVPASPLFRTPPR